jgi:hypothetical protein
MIPAPKRRRAGSASVAHNPAPDADRRYRLARLAMRGGVAVAVLAVLALPPGETSLGLFAAATAAVAWGAWQRHRNCPARKVRADNVKATPDGIRQPGRATRR